jgi:SAM-dependent methyltransferase
LVIKKITYMKSNINWLCDFCGTALDDQPLYEPIKSRRGAVVAQCPNCSLVQSLYTTSYQSRPPGNMSSDADRSSFRYTKTLVADSYQEMIETHIPRDIKRILDIGSNRGVFVTYAKQRFAHAHLFCIETDDSIVGYFDEDAVDGVIGRFEDVNVPQSEFDFAYSVHTFEHLRSAKMGFQKVFDAIKPNGRFLVAVPNLFLHADVIEEYFIDPHTFHFTPVTLARLAHEVGFEIIDQNSHDNSDVVFMLQKPEISRARECTGLDSQVSEVFDFAAYRQKLKQNRQAISSHADLLMAKSKNKNVVIWGGGRIFDALVRFGAVEPSDRLYVYDKFLSGVTESLNGFKLISREKLQELAQTDCLIYVASRDYRDEIIAEAKLLGCSAFLVFGDEHV